MCFGSGNASTENQPVQVIQAGPAPQPIPTYTTTGEADPSQAAHNRQAGENGANKLHTGRGVYDNVVARFGSAASSAATRVASFGSARAA